MCKNKISFTIPTEPRYLLAAADMLTSLAEAEPEDVTISGMHAGQPDCCPEECAPDKALTMVDPVVATVPVPVPAAAAPPVAVPPVPEPVSTGISSTPPPTTHDMSTLDSAGLPWDARIHAATKTMMKGDGTWKKKRGSDPAEVEQVNVELRNAVLHATLPPAPAAAPPAAAVPPAPAAAVPPVPPAAVPPAPAAPEVMSFPSLVAEVTNKQNMGLITPEEVNAVAQQHGIPAFPVLASKPELIPAVHAALVAIWTPRTAS